ncbi:MAG TPA: hypothetical protein VEI97_00530, partial [bacterium]|nr:hypothetical protein [bacterium]
MPHGQPLVPGTEVIWFIIFMAAFYAIQVPLRRTWQLSLEGVWLTGFAALAITFYFRVGINLLLLTGVCLALLVAVALGWAVGLRRALEVERELPHEVPAGTPFTIVYKLRNTAKVWLTGLVLRDRAMRGILPLAGTGEPGLPKGQSLAPRRISLAEYDAGRFEDDPFDLHPSQRAAPVFSPLRLFLRPGEELLLEQPVVFGARGLYRLGPIETVVKDPMGLHGIAALVPSWDALRVLPKWEQLEDLPRELFTVWRQEEETT